MKIIVWGINYLPEVTGIAPHNAALCESLKARGHEVEMVTTFCYYPAWKKLGADHGRLFRSDEVNGVAVHRCWHYVPAKPANVKRILHELSFIVTSLWRMLTLERPDLIIAVSPPLLIGAAAWLAGKLKNAPFIFHLQDLQPDGALELGMLKPGFFVSMLQKLEAFAYRRALRVSGISHGMLDVLSKKQVPVSKLVYFPNTITIPPPGEIPGRGLFRSKHGLGNGDFLAVYSGNLGVKHGLQVLIEAAELVREKRVHILISGVGAVRDSIAGLISRRGLTNVRLLPLQSDFDYRCMLADADLCLITQQKGSARAFFPSKLLNALASATPVLAVADAGSELSRVLETGKFGVRVPANEPALLARELDRLAAEPAILKDLGAAGAKFAIQFDREGVLGDFATMLEETIKRGGRETESEKDRHRPLGALSAESLRLEDETE